MPKRPQTLPKKPEPDTEPDDAFSLVLGDVNHSPLMRHGQAPVIPDVQMPGPTGAVDLAPSDSRRDQGSALSVREKPQADLFNGLTEIGLGPHSEAFRHPGLSPVAFSEPIAEPENEPAPPPLMQQQQQRDSLKGLHPWLEIQLDTCTVTPAPEVLEAPDVQAQEALRQALLAAMQQDSAVLRLNLGRRTIAPRVLALALDCSRHLQSGDRSRRLVLANCPDELKSMFNKLKLLKKYDIAHS